MYCFTLSISQQHDLLTKRQNEDSRKRKTAELNSVLAKDHRIREHRVPKTGDNTHSDAKQGMLQKTGGFYQSPTLLVWEL